MNILGIETSCDETAAAVVKDGRQVLSSIVATSHDFHSQFGGVLPELASRKQLECMIPVLTQALQDAFGNTAVSFYELIQHNIDAIAVTVGPGLIGSLLIGTECAKTLSYTTDIPVIPVNHVHAHIYANFISSQGNRPNSTSFPAIALVVSGGHTELFLMQDEQTLKWLGGTIDDAAGEAFDKSARLLGLGNGGGKAIEEHASAYTNKTTRLLKLPRPLIHEDSYRFSFSGLKTAVQREWNTYNEQFQKNKETTQILFAYEIQEAITDVLVKKTLRAAAMYTVDSILVGGGVSANKTLHQKFLDKTKETNISVFVPSIELCTDNAAAIASCAFFHYSPQNYRFISATPSLGV
jgi:N6-L-threonylcarbamoyladenine synthase